MRGRIFRTLASSPVPSAAQLTLLFLARGTTVVSIAVLSAAFMGVLRS
jgi:hypothetical protein